MRDWRNIGQDGYRKGGIQDRMVTGKEGFRTGGVQVRSGSGQEGFRREGVKTNWYDGKLVQIISSTSSIFVVYCNVVIPS